MHVLDRVPPPVAALFAFAFGGWFLWAARNPSRARGSEEQQAQFRWLNPIAASLLDDMSDRAIRLMLLTFGAVFFGVGVLGLFI